MTPMSTTPLNPLTLPPVTATHTIPTATQLPHLAATPGTHIAKNPQHPHLHATPGPAAHPQHHPAIPGLAANHPHLIVIAVDGAPAPIPLQKLTTPTSMMETHPMSIITQLLHPSLESLVTPPQMSMSKKSITQLPGTFQERSLSRSKEP